jgi:hypothetical protein
MCVSQSGAKIEIPFDIDSKSFHHHEPGAKTRPDVLSNANLDILTNTLAVSLNQKAFDCGQRRENLDVIADAPVIGSWAFCRPARTAQ